MGQESSTRVGNKEDVNCDNMGRDALISNVQGIFATMQDTHDFPSGRPRGRARFLRRCPDGAGRVVGGRGAIPECLHAPCLHNVVWLLWLLLVGTHHPKTSLLSFRSCGCRMCHVKTF